MSRDTVVGRIEDGALNITDEARIPLYLKRTGDVEGWLTGRAIDPHRVNARLLKKALGLTGMNGAELALKVFAATVTDAYWFRPAGSGLPYARVRFRRNIFDSLALRGDPDGFNLPCESTPELTNTGRYEKCWRLESGGWLLVKQGSGQELFSELFAYHLGAALGFPMAEYRLENDCVISPDFTNGAAVSFEAASGLVGDDDDYGRSFSFLHGMSPELARQNLEIIYLDTLVFNIHRHTGNYGVLRDVDSGAVLSMAPNFDNNAALLAAGAPIRIGRGDDKLVSLFTEFLDRDMRARAIAEALPVPERGQIEECAARSGTEADPGAVAAFILEGSDRIQAFLKERSRRKKASC